MTSVSILDVQTGDAVLLGAEPPPSGTDAAGRPTWDSGTLAPGGEFRIVASFGPPPDGNCAYADDVVVVSATPAGGEAEDYVALADFGVNVGPCVFIQPTFCEHFPPGDGFSVFAPCDEKVWWAAPPDGGDYQPVFNPIPGFTVPEVEDELADQVGSMPVRLGEPVELFFPTGRMRYFFTVGGVAGKTLDIVLDGPGNTTSFAGQVFVNSDHTQGFIILDPDLADAHIQLGSLHLAQQRLDEAAARFRNAILADPTNPAGYGSLGVVYLQLGQNDAVRRLFERVLQLDPDNEHARALLRQLQ